MLQTLKNHQKSVVTTCAIFRLTCGQGILVADASTKAYGGVHQKSLPTLGTTRDFEVRVQCKILIDQRVRRHICVLLWFIGRVFRRPKSLPCWNAFPAWISAVVTMTCDTDHIARYFSWHYCIASLTAVRSNSKPLILTHTIPLS